ncbi:class I SAM-dependent methyltransferase [Neosynechococcus sphagnicola]|uniref:class I SAM-dependent methyltransferase n=1 Tax=Neosynechococcus sphagnicola TaxID=1501145 RepID=UPI00068FD903|nr:methyltransferase domain-containing protein [Neosynechococcus sphagnicola]
MQSYYATRKLRLDLGCGGSRSQGFVGVDCYPAPGVDIVADLTRTFPFSDSSVDQIKAYNIIEHLPDRIHTMNEIWRVCKPGAIVDILVPSTDGRGAFQDPTHISFWNINSFLYYCIEFPPYLSLCHQYGFQGTFQATRLEQVLSPGEIIYVIAQLVVVKQGQGINAALPLTCNDAFIQDLYQQYAQLSATQHQQRPMIPLHPLLPCLEDYWKNPLNLGARETLKKRVSELLSYF